MRSTISDNRQLFNVKALAAAGLTAGEIPDGQFAIIDEATGLTVAPVDYAGLPDKFRLLSKLNGKVYYSFDTIEKRYHDFETVSSRNYQSERVNTWRTVIESCDCTKGVRLDINIEEDSLLRNYGMTWANKDFFVELSPKELECLCDCTNKGTYENQVMTKLLYEKIQAINSPFYEALVETADGATSFANATEIQAYIDANEGINTDDDETNDGQKFALIIKGKPQPAGNYADLEVNYIYPRGVKLNPAMTVNFDTAVPFEEIIPLSFEIGAGYDLRAEEFDCMSLYTTLNFYPQLSDGIANSKDLVYQFENGKNYDTISFEFSSKKSGLEDVHEGNMKKFHILLGTETGTALSDRLNSIFTPA